MIDRLRYLAYQHDWIDDEGTSIVDRQTMGAELVDVCGDATHLFRYLQTLIAGEGRQLPFAGPCVKIVTAREDKWKEEFALVYGYPWERDEDGTITGVSDLATRIPEEAAVFKIYCGKNYGPGGYARHEMVAPISDEQKQEFAVGDFTDEEAAQLLAQSDHWQQVYDKLLIAARDPSLNPVFASRVEADFYKDAAKIGL